MLKPELVRIVNAVCRAKRRGLSDGEIGEAFLVAMRIASAAKSINLVFRYPRERAKKSKNKSKKGKE